jgi:hypothetical protein
MRVNCLVLFLCFIACTQKPARARFPGPPGRTTEFQQAKTTQEVLGGFDPNAKRQEEDAAIRGIVKLKPNLSLPKKPYMIFISARSLGGGPPLAASRMGPRKIPFRFVLSQANVMMQGTKLEGFVEVTVRLSQIKEDKSYDPFSRQPGDLFGSKQVKVGVKNLEILINEAVK